MRPAVAAGGAIRDGLQTDVIGRRVPSIFDPFGHIWGLVEHKAEGMSLAPSSLANIRREILTLRASFATDLRPVSPTVHNRLGTNSNKATRPLMPLSPFYV